jgi:hypothetical protein
MRFLLCLLTISLSAAEVTVEQVNKALGVELFADANLWDDDVAAVSGRLEWPMESETSSDASFRLYPKDTYRVLACRPYSCSLLATQKKPTSLSLMFANKGDAVSFVKDPKDKAKSKARDEQIKDFKKAIVDDAKDIAAKLTELFGAPVSDKLGQGRGTSESVRRWDWNGHAFLLAAPKDEYVALRILSVKSADDGGKTRMTDVDLIALAKTRVDRRANGDVILKDIPMVNQGPKGYCVPATWERVMRYMGVPADMYVLAMAGQSGAGGGTSIQGIANGAKDAVSRGGRKLDSVSLKIDPSSVSKYIDRGLPVMWTMSSTKAYNDIANARTKQRADMKDAATWKKELADSRKGQKALQPVRTEAHMCMIVGYNKETGEIAVSDSWGPEFEERWIHAAEANQVSFGIFMVIGI